MSPDRLRFTGRLSELSARDRDVLFHRATERDDMVRTTTEAIIDLVRREGDTALRALAREYDKARLTSLEVPRSEWRQALAALDGALRTAMEHAARNIEAAHRAFLPQASETTTEPGIVIGRRPDPLRRVGVYAPGGRAAYPSSVLMGVVPARVAGVEEVIVCSPPDTSGRPSPAVLAAAELANADRLFAIGGAGAIAAMAYGTASVPRVDRIVGPGNAYVAEAKIQVSSAVGIDAPAGPSELLVIADASTQPALIAREMLAQAEHDPQAAVVAITIGDTIGQRVIAALSDQLRRLGRREIAAVALAGQGAVLETDSISQAIAFSNEYAPEHLLLAVADPQAALFDVRNAGTVFLGETTSVTFGDYMTGANHVLPTGGLARSYSGLSPLDFVRWTTYQRVDLDAARRLATDVGTFAAAERLGGHAAAAMAWSTEERATRPDVPFTMLDRQPDRGTSQ